MKYRHLFLIISFWFGAVSIALAQTAPDHLGAYTLQDSLGIMLPTPELVVVIDSITPNSLRPLDSLQKKAITDSLSKSFFNNRFNLKELVDHYGLPAKPTEHSEGKKIAKGNVWILISIAILLVLFAVLKNAFSKQLNAVVQSFYSNRALTNLNKEENLLTSWPFLLLFIQFGFTIGMFFFLVAQYRDIPEVRNGFKFFFTVSVAVIFLYLLKIIVLRLLGFVFDLRKPLNEYISILYLSYFNTSLLFIPLILAFALSPLNYGPFYIAIGIGLIAIIFIFQFLRAGVNILSQYRFSNIYLFLYFCTLEICPILILIKAIGL